MIAGLLCNIIHLNREETVKIMSVMVDKQNINNKSPGDSDCKESACNAGDMGWNLGWDDPLEKGVVTHSSILSWRIPWAEGPGGLQSMGSPRVRHK